MKIDNGKWQIRKRRLAKQGNRNSQFTICNLPLQNRYGFAYIYLCVIVLFISMLLSVLILYMGLCAQVQIQKRDMKAKLDGYVADYTITAFDALKQGDRADGYIDLADLENGCYSALGFDSVSTEYAYDNGNCTVSRPTVTVLSGGGFGLTIEYIATFPIKWNAKSYDALTVPITITSFYKIK